MRRPHDEFFKFVFGVPDRTAGLINLALPGLSPPSSRLRFDRLEPVPKSFVTPRLRARSSDLLFKTHLGQLPLFVYILFEHKSSPEASTLLQLLVYMTEIWRPFGEEQKLDLHEALASEVLAPRVGSVET